MHFDYASTKRPLLGVKSISDARFRKMINKLGIVDIPSEYERITGTSFVQVKPPPQQSSSSEHRSRRASQNASRGTGINTSTSISMSRSISSSSDSNPASPRSSAPSVPGRTRRGSFQGTGGSKPSSERRTSADRQGIAEEKSTTEVVRKSSSGGYWNSGPQSLKSDCSSLDTLKTVIEDLSATPFQFPSSSPSSFPSSFPSLSPAIPQSPLKNQKFRGKVSAIMMSSHALKEIRAKTAATPAPILFPLTANLIKDHHYEYIDTCYHNHDIYRVEKQRDVSRSSYVIGLCILHTV